MTARCDRLAKEKEQRDIEKKLLKEQQKKDGTFKTKKQLKDEARRRAQLEDLGITADVPKRRG